MREPLSLYGEGVALFNAGRYWDAHEAWEEIWLQSAGDARLGLQALIQMAAAFYHIERENFRGAARLFAAAADKLERTSEAFPGLDQKELIECLRRGAEEPGTVSPPALEGLPEGSARLPGGWCSNRPAD